MFYYEAHVIMPLQLKEGKWTPDKRDISEHQFVSYVRRLGKIARQKDCVSVSFDPAHEVCTMKFRDGAVFKCRSPVVEQAVLPEFEKKSMTNFNLI